MGEYVLGYEGSDDAHVYGDGGLVQVGHALVLDDMGGEDVNHEDDDEDERLYVECLRSHLFRFYKMGDR